jgi:hypothetical protein
MSRLNKKVENMQLEGLNILKMPKDDMIKLLEKAKDENPELFDLLAGAIEQQYSSEGGEE